MDQFEILVNQFYNEKDSAKLNSLIYKINESYDLFKLQKLFENDKLKLFDLLKKITNKLSLCDLKIYNSNEFTDFTVQSYLALERVNYAVNNNIMELHRDANFIRMKYSLTPKDIINLLNSYPFTKKTSAGY